jgi:PIN domain nuclease of toxin-antitoxin system
VRLLLDTHAFLWMLQDPERLGASAAAALVDGDNELLLSIGSCWEMAIKHAAGRLTLPSPYLEFMETQLAKNRIGVLPISLGHLGRLGTLAKRDHRDPFDRLLAAQALADGLSVVSRDGAFDGYGVHRVW